jgi:hypothetical protein
LKSGEPKVNAGGCSLLSEGVTVVIRDHFQYSILLLTCVIILYLHFSKEYMKEIYEGQTHRKPYFGSLLEKGFLHLAVFLDKNLNVTELRYSVCGI